MKSGRFNLVSFCTSLPPASKEKFFKNKELLGAGGDTE